MERTIKNAHEEICAYCGNRYITKPGRFPVCECGNTEPLTKNRTHGMICDGHILNIIENDSHRAASYSLIHETDYFSVIQALHNIPILNGKEVRRQYLDNTDFTHSLKTWELLSHTVHYNNSPLYRLFLGHGMYACCKAIIESAIPRTEVPDNEAVFIEKVKSLVKKENNNGAKYINIVIDGALEDFSSETIRILAESRISVVSFLSLIASENLTIEQTLTDITEFADIAHSGDAIIEKIEEYYKIIKWFKRELGYVPAIAAGNHTPLPLRLFNAKNVMRISVANGVYAVKKLLASYNRENMDLDNKVTVNNLVMRPITRDEILSCPLVMDIPVGGVTATPLVIVNENTNEIESIVFSVVDSTFIEGNCDDMHKRIANCYFDTYK